MSRSNIALSDSEGAIIDVQRLSKNYGEVQVLKGITFQVYTGEVFGFLGPNGAGKTTTIRILTGSLKPSEGTARVFSLDVTKENDRIRPKIGVVLQEPSAEPWLTVEANLDMYGRLWGIPKSMREGRKRELLKVFGLEDVRKRMPYQISSGERRRLQVAREFMHAAEILFLDEPTTGLDPLARKVALDYIREAVREREATVFFTTQLMQEAEYLCDRVAIINRGSILTIGSVQQTKAIVGDYSMIELEIRNGLQFNWKELEKLPYIREIVVAGAKNSRVKLVVSDAETSLEETLRILRSNGIRLDSFSIRPLNLDEVFVMVVGR